MENDINKLIIKVLTDWGEKVVIDIKAEIDKKITHNGGQTSALSGSVNYKVINKGGEISWLLTMNPYWEVVEKGRGAGKKAPPNKPIEDWLRQKESITSNINKILVSISVKHKGISSRKRKGVFTSKGTKGMKFDAKIKSLSYMIAKSIGKKGIKPRPFLHNVVNENRINELKEMLAPVLKQYYILEFK